MKTTVDIPDKVMEEALEHSHASSHAEVLIAALTEYNRRRRGKPTPDDAPATSPAESASDESPLEQ